jgi:hypothetical protein
MRPARCPKCDHTDVHIFNHAPEYYPVLGIEADGTMVISSYPEVTTADPTDDCFLCMACGHLWPVPAGVRWS